MTESSVAVSAGSGTLLHTNTRTISAQTMHDQYSLPGEYPYASYTIIANNISIATANDHVLQIMAGSSLNVRVRSITIEQNANVTTASRCTFSLFRLSTAGTGGTTVTPRAMDTADSAAGATAMTLPTAKGTEGNELDTSILVLRQAFLTTATQPEEIITWAAPLGFKPYLIAAGTSNGLAVKVTSAQAGGTVTVVAKIVETAFV